MPTLLITCHPKLTRSGEDAILEVPETATAQQIRDAYKRYISPHLIFELLVNHFRDMRTEPTRLHHLSDFHTEPL